MSLSGGGLVAEIYQYADAVWLSNGLETVKLSGGQLDVIRGMLQGTAPLPSAPAS